MSQNRMSEVRTSRREVGQEQRLFTFKATQLIWLGLVLLEALIALRIGLKIIGANPDNLFAAFTYSVSQVFLFPFEGLVNNPARGAMVLELSSIIAMVVYAMLAWAFERIVWLIFYRPRGSVVGVTQTTTSEPVAVLQTTTREPVAFVQTTTREPVAVVQTTTSEPVAVLQTTTHEE
jgi:YggT family protein